MNRKAFYDALRSHVNLTTQNVAGMERVLTYGEKRGIRREKFAYIIATAWWETAQTMQPVVEAYWLSEGWRQRNLRYYPWHGRGLIQTTWKANYAKMGKEIGVDLLADPDLLLAWDYALPALFVGMEKGLYTGKDLSDYIDDIDESDDDDLREYIAARRIVNGTDKATTIGRLALVFENALTAAGYEPVAEPGTPSPVPEQGAPVPDDPGVPEPDMDPDMERDPWWRRLLGAAGGVALLALLALIIFDLLKG